MEISNIHFHEVFFQKLSFFLSFSLGWNSLKKDWTSTVKTWETIDSQIDE